MELHFGRCNSDHMCRSAGLRRLTIKRRFVMRRRFLSFAAALAFALPAMAQVPTIYGTMSNFDVFNQSTVDAYGAEMDLERAHSKQMTNTYPSHYSSKSQTD